MFGAILFFCFCISERNIINKVSLFDNGKKKKIKERKVEQGRVIDGKR